MSEWGENRISQRVDTRCGNCRSCGNQSKEAFGNFFLDDFHKLLGKASATKRAPPFPQFPQAPTT
jgi:hypothetical protein